MSRHRLVQTASDALCDEPNGVSSGRGIRGSCRRRCGPGCRARSHRPRCPASAQATPARPCSSSARAATRCDCRRTRCRSGPRPSSRAGRRGTDPKRRLSGPALRSCQHPESRAPGHRPRPPPADPGRARAETTRSPAASARTRRAMAANRSPTRTWSATTVAARTWTTSTRARSTATAPWTPTGRGTAATSSRRSAPAVRSCRLPPQSHAEGLRAAVTGSASQVVLDQPDGGTGTALHPELLEDSPDVNLYRARRDVECRAYLLVGLASSQ